MEGRRTMKVILCADEKNGLMFNHRRQSRDRELRKRILSIIGDEKLYLSAYSAGQFAEEEWADKLAICEDPMAAADRGVYYFAEGQPLIPVAEAGAIEEVILYRWNKVYPADTWLDLPLTNAASWQLRSSEDLAGCSHERITEEIYRPV